MDNFCTVYEYIDGLVQDCSNSSALAMELLQSCTKPLIYGSITKQNVGDTQQQQNWNKDFLIFLSNISNHPTVYKKQIPSRSGFLLRFS